MFPSHVPRYIPKLMLSKKHNINLFTLYETDYLPSFTSSQSHRIYQLVRKF
ncbi:hypothetical protein IFVP182_C290715 [Vibrio parahaemolyticus]